MMSSDYQNQFKILVKYTKYEKLTSNFVVSIVPADGLEP